MHDQRVEEADRAASRVALWRAMHVQVDAPPHVLEDEIGLRLIAPEDDWRQRPDMDPEITRGYRAAVVARARFIEDLVAEQSGWKPLQYVILGAGLDTFAQRRPAPGLKIFEIDRPGRQAWKRRRLIEAGFGIPDGLRMVPVDFASGQCWRAALNEAGFDAAQPAIVAFTGASMYLTREANLATLRQIAAFAPGSTLAMTFMLPLEQVPDEDRPALEAVHQRARRAGTPFISLFSPAEMLSLAGEAGFREAIHVSCADLVESYFTGRSDGLRPASGEEFLVAMT